MSKIVNLWSHFFFFASTHAILVCTQNTCEALSLGLSVFNSEVKKKAMTLCLHLGFPIFPLFFLSCAPKWWRCGWDNFLAWITCASLVTQKNEVKTGNAENVCAHHQCSKCSMLTVSIYVIYSRSEYYGNKTIKKLNRTRLHGPNAIIAFNILFHRVEVERWLLHSKSANKKKKIKSNVCLWLVFDLFSNSTM